MELMQAIEDRRAIRKYKTDPIPEEDIGILLEAARWAPSWGNTQAWRLVVVQDAATRLKLADTLISGRPDRKNFAYQAVVDCPVVIVACGQRGVSGFFYSGDKKGQPSTDKGDYWYMFDLGLAMQNLTLAAHSLGLGTVHVGMFDNVLAGKIVGVPQDVAIVEILPVGWPAESPAPRPRKDVSEFAFRDRFGVGWGTKS